MGNSLLLTRRFAPLFWCQFFSAFSDNFLKNVLVFLILFKIGGPDAEALITLAAAVFISPYFFLSALGGEIADRYDKAFVAQRLKLAEVGVALLAVIGFTTHSVIVLFVALFLFGVIASLFGPIKYGILPDHLQRSELPAGNALVEGATFIAILLGTIVGGLAAKNGGDPASFAMLMIVFSLMCWGASLLIPATGQGAPDLKIEQNVFRSTVTLLKDLQTDRRIWWGAFVASWFWLVGAVALSLLPPLVKNALGGAEEVVTVCLAIFSISIAIFTARIWKSVSSGISGRRRSSKMWTHSSGRSKRTFRRRAICAAKKPGEVKTAGAQRRALLPESGCCRQCGELAY